jgi:transcriptional regulator with XRE-family HTH domain
MPYVTRRWIVLDSVAIGKRLSAARKSAGLTQKQVAAYLGVQREAVAYIETGSRPVTTSSLGKLADLYGFKMTYFLEENRVEEEPVVMAAFRTRNLSDADLETIAGIKRIALNLDSMYRLAKTNHE